MCTHRDWIWFVLSTGMRKTAASNVEWEHLEGDILLCPNPKGGETRAFRLPLSEQQVALLNERPRVGRWVFPNVHNSGPIKEPIPRDLPQPHHLRAEYIALCTDLGVPTYQKKLLVNHSVPRIDVSEGYVAHPNVEMCRPYQQKISDHLWNYFQLS